MDDSSLLDAWLENEPTVTIPCVAASAVALVLSLSGWLASLLPVDPAWVAVALCGVPILVGALRGVVFDHDIKADVLVSLALLASLYAGEWFAAGEVALIMQVGTLLEDYTSERARKGIERLVSLAPEVAHVVGEDGERTVRSEDVRVGDVVRVRAGETIPVDGVVLEGATSVDQSVMTGESIPVDKGPGDEVSSGTVNQLGAFTMRAVRACEDSSLRRMVRLAEEADAGKAPIVGLADRWATWLVLVALACAAAAWAVTGEFLRAVTVLVVFCPCAFILATPTAVAAGIANATRHGVLVRSGDALERLARVTRVALDKTGTLTRGTPRVAAALSLDDELDEDGVLALAAAVERASEHPLGRAIVASWQERSGRTEPDAVRDFEVLAGRGVRARVDEGELLAGKAALLEGAGVDLAAAEAFVAEWQRRGAVVIYLARAGRLVGAVALTDQIREQAADSIARLASLGVTPMLLTGDSGAAAHDVASAVGIDDVRSDLLPEEKLAIVRESAGTGERVCMVGDGVNDALALKSAYVGVAMGGIGSDIAVESSDAVLVSDDVARIPYLIALSRAVMAKVRQNIVLGLCINLVAVCLSMAGALNPVTAALFHNVGSVFVVVNAATLLGRSER